MNMKTAIYALLIFSITLFSCEKSEVGNLLKHEKSPYLLQHKNNPVWWNAWGEKALARAKKENKVIFLSIGYSTCHWCHVMEHESFEDKEVAKILNDNFIAIKVDREERPDVDKVYMNALHSMKQRGGWPLSMWLTPDLEPIYGGTYFPKKQFIKLLSVMADKWKTDRDKIASGGKEFTKFLNQRARIWTHSDKAPTSTIFKTALTQISETFEPLFGGFSEAPKFPPSTRLRVLLRLLNRNKDSVTNKVMKEMISRTLDSMFRGGIYDHLGGGFHRYSTDTRWLVPHFEKMLYDNALLSSTYTEAFLLTGNPLYKKIAIDILEYINRDMSASGGGYFSAEDADSEGHEGLFYLWKEEELKGILTASEYKIFKKQFGTSKTGNFEGKNLLNMIGAKSPEKTFTAELVAIKKKLFLEREKKIHPYKDDKILTAWNGLMLSAQAKAYSAFNDKRFLQSAEKTATFIRNNLDRNSKLKRRYRAGEARFDAYLDDYAYLIEGLMNLYEASFNGKYLSWAEDLQERQDSNLWNAEQKAYAFAKSNKNLIVNTFELTDNARPNSNGTSLLNLNKLYAFTFKKKYKEKRDQLMKAYGKAFNKFPSHVAQALLALDYHLDAAKEVVIVGKNDEQNTQKLLSTVRQNFLPNKVLAFGNNISRKYVPLVKDKVAIGGVATAYVCLENICKLPVRDPNKLKSQLDDLVSLNISLKKTTKE
ncbi:MAG: thioredoxin domain-containing protein [Halobacteriovoraceae bacterium]|nr:thioredoxin domain-containing protein [Halobacteriovoraceae bacterium]